MLLLIESLQKIQDIDSSCLIILAGDFNFPDISWEHGIGYVRAGPTYGNEVNPFLLIYLMTLVLNN